MTELAQMVVVITGAGSGIGRATALAFARRGSSLHLVDVDAAAVGATVKQVRQRGARGTAHVFDCADDQALLELADEIRLGDGRVDVVHVNAGICCGGPVEALPLADWKRTVDTNLWGAIAAVHAFVPLMIVQRSGHLIFTSSMAGLIGFPLVAPYCTTKFALVGLAESLGAELGVHGIHVTAICPGSTRTGLMANARGPLGPVQDRMRALLERWAPGPERVASQVVRAVQHPRGLVVMPGEFAPLWMLRRVSIGLYQRLARSLTSRARRSLEM